MEFGQIQNTDIRPSRIGLGTWAIGGWKWGGADDDAAVATIQRALDSGINLIDTAPAYGQGHSEEIVGRAIQGRRERVGRSVQLQVGEMTAELLVDRVGSHQHATSASFA